jgi:glycosyltransferase involved in cell wall biosynthesis
MMAQALPSVSVIIPVRDQAAELDACLDALRASATCCSSCEVIVVDDGSSDSSAAIARAHGARVLRLDRRGPAAARNAGARLATGEAVVFLDADCRPEPGCLQALVAPLADPQVQGVRGAYESRQTSLVARFVQLELGEKEARLAASAEIAVVDTACAAYRRSVLEACGGFDESFPATSVEDVELSFRLTAQGKRLVFTPLARVQHRHVEHLHGYLGRKLRFGFYRAQLYHRYPERLREDGYTPRLMPVQIALSALLGSSLALSPRIPGLRPLARLVAVVFLATTLPLARRAWHTDRPLAWYVPALLLARSLAQGLGLLLGVLALIMSGLLRAFGDTLQRAAPPRSEGPDGVRADCHAS